MDYTQSRGNIVELQCISKFIEMGYECSIPYGNGAKYDFIVDYNGELLKIQCKSSHHPIKNGIIDEDAIMFSAVAQTTNTKKTTRHRYSNDMIDYFATYFDGQVYIIPVDECSGSKTLRLAEPKNKGVTYNKAEDYKIENYFKSSIEAPMIDREIKHFSCALCGAEVKEEGCLCVKCSHIKQRIVDRPPREELKKLIRSKSFVEIADIYGVSDNAIRKWCDAEKLPRKKSEIKKISDKDWEQI